MRSREENRENYDSMSLNDKLVYNLRDMAKIIRHCTEARGGQGRALLLLQEHSVLTQRQLTEMMHIQPGSASELIRRLEDQDLIVRRPNREDARTWDVVLTAEGLKKAQQIKVDDADTVEQMFALLGDEDKALLLGLLEKLDQGWEEYRPKHHGRRPDGTEGSEGGRHHHGGHHRHGCPEDGPEGVHRHHGEFGHKGCGQAPRFRWDGRPCGPHHECPGHPHRNWNSLDFRHC